MTTREILIAARKRIEDPKDWAGAMGEKLGRDTDCAVTATDLDDISWGERFGAIEALVEQISGAREGDPALAIIDYNESHTHAEVLALYDRAIEAAS